MEKKKEMEEGYHDKMEEGAHDKMEEGAHDKDKMEEKKHSRVKGEKVYDDYTEVGDVEIKVEDVEMVTENIIGKVKLEIKSGI